MPPFDKLAGQRVVVLGGTSGIGLAVAEAAAAAGAVVTVASSRKENVERALDRLPAGSTGEVADLTDPALVRDLFARLGEIDHLVYTAGDPLPLAPVTEIDLDAARDFFALRYFGVLAAVQAAVPKLREGGSITLTTGTAGPRPVPGAAVTASICGAMEGLTRALAVELAPIRVNAVMPGVVRSNLWASLPDDFREQLYADTAAATPLNRVGEVDDIAEAYLYTMTQRHATGTIMTLDGGAVLT
ncbi:SDR family oxidoreductase [Actinomadura harenae]|uniref:SDR family oxidoreductase n=1 Tax=Actinomadura harenae TaxID=2483351 RepID=A0A3M2LWK4_9ACTN|nr:SDR family oxidoreductase [Actinomadura harenae]RMI41592.1 SDR family oxidoreductase [Actinomadura harenae]